jgi:hypothetical protein
MSNVRQSQRDSAIESNDDYHGGNTNRTINSEQYFEKVLFPYIESLTRVKLLATDKMFIKNAVKDSSSEFYRDKTVPQITKELSQIFIQKLKILSRKNKDVDMHEVAKKEMGLASEQETEYEFKTPKDVMMAVEEVIEQPKEVLLTKFLGISDADKIKEMLKQPDAYRLKKIYIMLDTKYRTLSESGTTRFSWNYVSTINATQGTVNSVETISNIISMKVLPIRIPNVASFTANGFKRITMLIDEFSSQAFVAQEGRRFHFDFKVSTDTPWLDLNPYEMNEGIFVFNKPFTVVNTISVSFANPVQPLTFSSDRITSTTNYANPTVITTESAHGLTTGDYVIIEGFKTSDDTTYNSYVSAMNTLSGLVATVTGATTFTVPVNLTPLQTTVTTYANTGTFTATNGSTAITGSGTAFLAQLTTSLLIYSNAYRTFFTCATPSASSNTAATIPTAYTGTTESGLFGYNARTGTVAVVYDSATITGTGTTFTTQYTAGDYIVVNPSTSGLTTQIYRISSIESNTSLTLTSRYTSTTVSGLTHFRFTYPTVPIYPNLSFKTFIQNRRIFIPMEFTMLP